MAKWSAILSLALLLGSAMPGCGVVRTQETAFIPPKRTLADIPEPEELTVIDVYDPLEPFNRLVYLFNAQFDTYIFLPVVNAYRFITPDPLADGISNFFANIREINSFINTLLQLKFSRALKTATRFLVNTTVGIAGFWDPATRFGLLQHPADFGQTLGHYGLGPGPYLVIPLLGPSSLRDGTGVLVDSLAFFYIDPLQFRHFSEPEIPFYFMRTVDQRHRTDFRYYQTGSPFEYDLIRFLYLRVREAQIAK
jgi:phospholipid-binding lipoprotein MlaA